MEITKERTDFSRYGKAFQEQLCMAILDDRPFADQVEEVLDVSFLELKYLQLKILSTLKIHHWIFAVSKILNQP